MVERPGLLLRLLSFLVYSRVTVEEADLARIRRVAEQGTVVYVARARSLLDYLFFNWLLLRHGLDLARFAVGVSTLLFRPLVQLLRRIRSWRAGERPPDDAGALELALADGAPAFLFLERRRALTGRREPLAGDHVRQILRLQQDRERPILLVPLLVLWRARPERLKPSLIDALLGNAASPGRIRKLWTVLLSPRRAQLHVGEPVDVAALLAERAAEPEERLARKVRGALYVHLARRTRVAIGPRVRDRSRMLRDVVRALERSGDLEPVAEETGHPVAALARRARKLLGELAADLQIGSLHFFYWSLAFVWHRIYDGFELDEEGLQRVVDAAQKGPVILVPSHKSHVDYLIISWIFHDRGMLAPHIAAGANMNFFPVGFLFRRSGAFFLRRTFKGDPLYPIVFAAYLRRLLVQGYNIEFFIEGGRSRTGKILPPRLGLLKYITDAVLDPRGPRDVQLVPVAVGYERIVEAASYEREHSGGKKRAEDARGLLEARKVLKRRYGRLYVEFDEPVSLRGWLAGRGVDPGRLEPADRPPLVNVLGHHLAWRLTQTSTVMPISLVATALLCHPRRGLNRRDLLRKVGLLQAWAEVAGARFSGSLKAQLAAAGDDITKAASVLPEAPCVLTRCTDPEGATAAAARGEALAVIVDKAVELFTSDKTVTVHTYDDGGVVYTVGPDHRIRLDYYRNNLVPLLVPEAIVGTAVLAAAGGGVDPAEGARRLSRLLKREFLFRVDAPFSELFDRAASRLETMGLAERPEGGVLRPTDDGREALGFLREMLRPFLEAYLAAARTLLALGDGQDAEATAMRATAERLYNEGELSVPEACSGVTLKNAARVLGELEQPELEEAVRDLERLRGGPLGG